MGGVWKGALRWVGKSWEAWARESGETGEVEWEVSGAGWLRQDS